MNKPEWCCEIICTLTAVLTLVLHRFPSPPPASTLLTLSMPASIACKHSLLSWEEQCWHHTHYAILSTRRRVVGEYAFFSNQSARFGHEACTSGQRPCWSMLLQCRCICVPVCLCWFYPENEAGWHVKPKVTMMATSVCLPCSLWSAHIENIASLPHTNRREIWRQRQGPNSNTSPELPPDCMPVFLRWCCGSGVAEKEKI